MKLVWVALLACAHADAQPVFIRHPIGKKVIRGGVVSGDVLLTWGDQLIEWRLPHTKPRVLARADFAPAGCMMDADGDGRPDLIAQIGQGLGRLAWFRAGDWKPGRIDDDIGLHDCLAATIHGRRGVLIIHRGMQVRFYEPPVNMDEPWPYTELYSIYTPSAQAGLLMRDVDGDGRPDILCGNYWIRNPESFELPWKLFNIDTWFEQARSAMLRLVLATQWRIAAQMEMKPARLAWFERPPNPTDAWIEHRIDEAGPLSNLRALATAGFDGDGMIDIVAGEDNGAGSRLILFRNTGAGFSPQVIARGQPWIQAFTLDVNRDGKPDLITLGPDSVVWWENK